MATFLVLQQELADRLNLDQTVTANATRLKRWLNLIQADIASRYPFEWLYYRSYVQTQADKTDGTVAVSNGGTSVTGTGTTFAAGDKRSFIQLQGDTNWYEVTTVASQVLTISPAFAGTTLTAGTYKLRKVYYDLETYVFQVIDVRQSSTPTKLARIGIFTLDTYQPDIQTVGPPTAYYIFRNSPDVAATVSKQKQIAFFPSPDSIYNIEVRFTIVQADLSADGDIPFLPVPYHAALVDGAEWLGAKFLNDDNEAQLKTAYEFGLGKLIEQENAHLDWLPILGSTDTQRSTRFLPFPGTYEQPR